MIVKRYKPSRNIWRANTTTPAGNTLSFLYNPEKSLLVVDLVSADESAGNEIVRMELDDAKLLAHTVAD